MHCTLNLPGAAADVVQETVSTQATVVLTEAAHQLEEDQSSEAVAVVLAYLVLLARLALGLRIGAEVLMTDVMVRVTVAETLLTVAQVVATLVLVVGGNGSWTVHVRVMEEATVAVAQLARQASLRQCGENQISALSLVHAQRQDRWLRMRQRLGTQSAHACVTMNICSWRSYC